MNIRLTILLVFLLAIFGALGWWFKPWEQDTPRKEEPWAWRIDDDAIVHVEVTHQEQTLVYDKDLGRGKWFIVEGDERSEVYQQKWAGTPLLLSGPRVNRVLAETIENPAQYGLDPPESVIIITEETGLSYEFWLGNVTPDEGYNYMRLVGDPKLFTVPEIWATVVNRLVTEPPFIPPPLELGYFYDADFRDIQQLEVTHKGITVSYAPEPGQRTWYATVGDERSAVKPPEWWPLQLQWFGQPASRAVPRRRAVGTFRKTAPVTPNTGCSRRKPLYASSPTKRRTNFISVWGILRWTKTINRYWTTRAIRGCWCITRGCPRTRLFM